MARNSKKDIKVSTEDLQSQISVLQEDISTLANTIRDLTGQAGEEVKEAAKQRAEAMRSSLENGADRAGETVNAAYGHAQTAVREHPGAAMGLAAAVGFAAGMAMSRK